MKYYRCDQCKKEVDHPKVGLLGYYPHKAAGFLLPEHCQSHEFCSRECFLAWMRWAFKNEDN